MDIIEKVISVARGELGYLEKASNSNLDSKTSNAGYNNYTKYWQDVKPSYQGQPWCAAFVTWCFQKAYGKDIATKLLKHYPYVYCPQMASLFTLNANPKVGDVVIFKYSGQFSHTGIVVSVLGDYFETIEGNTSSGSTIVPNGGGVYQKGYYKSNLPGTKFCTPDWSLVSNVGGGSTTKTTNWIAELQKKINASVDGIAGPETLGKCPLLQNGSMGEVTRILQTRLNALGYNCGSVDGLFGQNTKKAVINYQKAKGLVADGIVGQNTWRKLLGL